MDFSKHIRPLSSEVDWPIWKRKIRDLLDYHEGALDVIDGKLTKPEPLNDGATTEQIKEQKNTCDLYRKANSYAKSMITSAVTDSVYQKIMDQDTACEAWEALKKQFEATSKDQLFKICSEFFSFHWIAGEDVSTHIAKLRSLWNELNNGLTSKRENPLPDLLIVCKTLSILPSSFSNFQSSWMLLTDDTKKTFNELVVQLCAFERNFLKESSGSSVVHEALETKHIKKFSKGKKFKPKKNNRCNYCKVEGHWVYQCPRWIADGKPKKSQETTEVANTSTLMFVEAEAFAVGEDSTTWWCDNGATRHVTNSSEYFTEFQRFDTPCFIRGAGKETLAAIGEGTVLMKSLEDDQNITLSKVWYVPGLCKNLFSVLAAHDKNPTSLFKSTATECWFLNKNKVILRGRRLHSGSLFKLDVQPVRPTKTTEINAINELSLLQLYHERWGHQDKRHVRAMLKKEFNINVPLEKTLCEPCIYGKAHRLPFGHRDKAKKPGELVSADICGPFSESFQKKRYLAIFKDSYTKFRCCYLLREKSEVKTVLKTFLQYSKVMGHNIIEFLSDNGGEFNNRDVGHILQENGITQRLTAPYTPQQDGNTEREMRTVVEMARTFKYSNEEACFPDALWAELVAAATYILNRTGKSSLEGISPYELWTGKKPRIRHLRIIGSTCYVHIPVQKRRKMDKKAIKGYLVGYDGDERYRIWVKEENKVYLSRDVTFNEQPGECEDRVELPLRDVERQNEGKQDVERQNEGKLTDEITDEFMSETDSITEHENHDEPEEEQEFPEPHRNLRNRSDLRKPKIYDNYVLLSEDIMSGIDTPESYEEVLNSKNKYEWKQAMDLEMMSLQENNTWELTTLPKGSRAIPCKWVYRVKTNPDGSVDKFKARLVIKGFSQRQGVDYSQTFSPVAKLSTIRSMLSIAAKENLSMLQFDISSAFLYGELEETVFMQQPEGYADNTDRVCRLKRSLYGLKQAPRCWSKRFNTFLIQAGFKVSEADSCLFIRKKGDKKLIIALYVDDGLVMSTHQQEIESFVKELEKEFKITVKPVSYYLGLEIERSEDGSIKISQQAYAKKILERFGFQDCKPVSTPMIKEPDVPKESRESYITDFPYRQAVGALMYLMVGTRPDLAFSVSYLSRSLDCVTAEDVTRLKRVLRYIAGTINLGIIYRPDLNSSLKCYCDADFGGCCKTGRSTSGVVVMYAHGAISWLSQRQAMTATSTTEAELVAATDATKEIIWLTNLYYSMGWTIKLPVLHVDNQSTVKLTQNPELHHRTKHIKVKYFFVREKVLEGALQVQYVPAEMQLADLLTKPLPRPRLFALLKQLGLG